jgi:primosomal replication protein N
VSISHPFGILIVRCVSCHESIIPEWIQQRLEKVLCVMPLVVAAGKRQACRFILVRLDQLTCGCCRASTVASG